MLSELGQEQQPDTVYSIYLRDIKGPNDTKLMCPYSHHATRKYHYPWPVH